MGVDRAIDITAKQRKIVTDLLERHLPNTTAWVYGSRAKWASRPQSDLDLVVFATPEQNGRVSDLREALEESNLPFRVDLFVWDAVPEQFRKQIKSEHVVLVEREERNVSDEWPVKTVQQLVEEGIMERPMDGNHGEVHPKSSDFLRDGIPFIMASNVSGGRVDTKNCAFISEDQAHSLRKGFSITGDVLISHKATMGRTALVGRLDVPFIMLTPQVTYYRVIDKGQLDPKYLKNYFDSPVFQQLFETWGQKGSTRSYLGITSQLDLPIVVPPPDVQKSIAHILGTLDDKIELNRRMNETLEAMARALFKSWFVDFDPVRAKMAGRDPGLPKHLADLFPDRLVESELGNIPEGWEVKSLDEIAVFQNGLALQKHRPQQNEERLPVVKIAQLRSGQAGSREWASANIKPECIINDGDIVFSWSGSLMVTIWCGGQAALNQHLFKVTSTQFPKWFCLYCTESHLPDFRRIASGKATTMGHIKRHHLTDAKCVVPPWQIFSSVDNTFSSLLSKTISLSLEPLTLAALRDTLLPKLVSGELRVVDNCRPC